MQVFESVFKLGMDTFMHIFTLNFINCQHFRCVHIFAESAYYFCHVSVRSNSAPVTRIGTKFDISELVEIGRKMSNFIKM